MIRRLLLVALLLVAQIAAPRAWYVGGGELQGFSIADQCEVHSWSSVGFTNSNTGSITGPSSVQAGDLAILFDAPSGSTVPSEVVPSGFTVIANLTYDFTSHNGRHILSYKILASGDITGGIMNSVTGMTGSTTSRKMIGVWRSTNPISSICILALQEEGVDNGNLTAQVIPSGAATQAALLLAHWRFANGQVSGNLTATGMTLTAGSSTAQYVGYRIYNSSPANQTVDTTITSDTQMLQTLFIY